MFDLCFGDDLMNRGQGWSILAEPGYERLGLETRNLRWPVLKLTECTHLLWITLKKSKMGLLVTKRVRRNLVRHGMACPSTPSHNSPPFHTTRDYVHFRLKEIFLKITHQLTSKGDISINTTTKIAITIRACNSLYSLHILHYVRQWWYLLWVSSVKSAV